MRLLIAEDDPRLLKSLMHIFEKNKYTAEGVQNGEDALACALTDAFDGLVLDIMMPRLDGLEVLRRLRQAGITTPALFLTARAEVEDRVEGLDAGADDYLPKPFSTEELLARVRAMLRRRDNYTADLLSFGGLSLDRATYELSCRNRRAVLSAKELQLMELLMERPRQVISTEECLSRAWGWNSDVDVSVVWVHISNIRKKLTALDAPAEIRFLRGAGYILEEKK